MTDPEHISTIMERVLCNLAELQEEADGWRRRNLIIDSQIEALARLVVEQQANLQVLQEIIKTFPQGNQIENRIARLTEAILKHERKNQGASDDSGTAGLEEMFR